MYEQQLLHCHYELFDGLLGTLIFEILVNNNKEQDAAEDTVNAIVTDAGDLDTHIKMFGCNNEEFQDMFIQFKICLRKLLFKASASMINKSQGKKQMRLLKLSRHLTTLRLTQNLRHQTASVVMT